MKTNRLGGLAIAAATLALVAACSSHKGPSTTSGSTPTTSATSSAGGASASSMTIVKTTSGPLGTYLADGAGRTLYLWVADGSGPSKCYGSCANVWPPLLASGTPEAGSGVDASKLGTVKRTDGKLQVTYDKHPLYYFVQDKAAGDTTGQGSNSFNAKWWVVGTNGAAITGSGGGSSSSSSGGSTY